MQQVTLADAAATQALAAALGQVISAGAVLLLNGDLGSGKTTFVQGLGAALGVKGPIVSPTFTIANEYPEARLPLYHFDLYRLQPEETAALNLEGYWEGEYPLGIVAIEWAERLKYWPQDYLEINLSISPGSIDPIDLTDPVDPADPAPSGRLAEFKAVGTRSQSLLQALLAEALGR